MARNLSIPDYISGLQAGNIAVLSKAITLIESSRSQDKELASKLIDAVLPYSGRSLRIGISGVPGAGKSTFIESFGMYLIGQGKKLAVLAIDPSSTLSKGSILGDKTRMEQLSVHPHAFIRPSATGGSLGGVTYKTHEAILLCEAAGFDTILIETVGVGQSETEVSHICDFFLLLMLAGAGDELQGIKRGIMELADGLLITKADGPNEAKAKSARSEYARALHFLPPQASGWIPEVKICSAYENKGIAEAWEMLERYQQHQQLNGFFDRRRRDQDIYAFQRLLQEQLRLQLLSRPGLAEQIQEVEAQITQGLLSPYSAVRKVLG